MIKPNGYDETKVGGGYTPVEIGGHTCVIKQVSETQSKTGKDMVVVLFDFDAADSQPNYFMDSYKFDERKDKKWPYRGTKYIMVIDYSDSTKTSKDFKAFCTSVEKSNPGFTVQWGTDSWGKQFVGKRIGAVYGLVESEYDGKVYTNPEIRWFCEYSKANDAKVPSVKYLKNKSSYANTSSSNDPFTDLSDDDSDLPF